MKSLTTFSLALTMLFCFLGFGQERTISGIVSDKYEVLPFVTVQIKGTQKATQTDFDGKFSIKVKAGDVLVFLYVGYETFELEIGEKISQYSIKLKSNVVLLQETYGDPVPRNKKEIPASKKITPKQVKRKSKT